MSLCLLIFLYTIIFPLICNIRRAKTSKNLIHNDFRQTQKCKETVKKALEMRKVPPLSKASLEVLAIVAYNQPVTRSFIETVRGVDSSSIVSSLCDKGLLAERGFLDAPGRPILFGTTDVFLRCFGLESIKDLPEADLSELPEQMTISEETEAVPVSEDADGPSESADGEGAESVS